jgi:hypothetical protein
VQDIQKYLADACYMIFLSYPINASVLQPNLQNYYPKNGYDVATPFLETSFKA